MISFTRLAEADTRTGWYILREESLEGGVAAATHRIGEEVKSYDLTRSSSYDLYWTSWSIDDTEDTSRLLITPQPPPLSFLLDGQDQQRISEL